MSRILSVCACFASALAIGITTASAAPCAPHGADPVDTIRQMYGAATAGDRARTLGAFDRDAYLFDVGVRYTPASLIDLILKAEAAGTKPQWHVDAAETHVSCDTAWATWTNHGSFTTAAGSLPKIWLESAVFSWRDGEWKIRFFHSTAVEPSH